MDTRFEGWVLAEIRNAPEVRMREAEISLLTAQYPQGQSRDTWSKVDLGELMRLEQGHARAEEEAREAAEDFWRQVRPGRVFLHRRYITENRQRERCIVTKMRYFHGELFQVYYRTADGAGMCVKADPMYFRTESFGSWV